MMPHQYWNLDKEDELVFVQVRELLATIITLMHEKHNRSKAGEALCTLLVRNANSWKSIFILLGTCSSEADFQTVSVDCGAILRCMYDAYLQAEYIVQDPAMREQRGELYLEYSHVERYRQARSLMEGSHASSQILRSSSRRVEGEARNQFEYDRVKAKFAGRGPDGVSNQWYLISLYELARVVGKLEYYRWFVSPLHGCIHSGPFAVRQGPGLPGARLIYTALTAVGMTAKLLVEQEQISLNQHQLEILHGCSSDPFV